MYSPKTLAMLLILGSTLSSPLALANKGANLAAAAAPPVIAAGMLSASELPGAVDPEDAAIRARKERLQQLRTQKQQMRRFGLPAISISP